MALYINNQIKKREKDNNKNINNNNNKVFNRDISNALIDCKKEKSIGKK